MTKPKALTIEQRFWAKVGRSGGPDACWPWQASLRNGYGQFGVRAGVVVYAHRFAYELLVGPIPDGKELDHVKARGCSGGRCVNPARLEPVSHTVNVLRGDACTAQKARATHCPRGHAFDAENTFRTRDGRRQCRACIQYRRRRWFDNRSAEKREEMNAARRVKRPQVAA